MFFRVFIISYLICVATRTPFATALISDQDLNDISEKEHSIKINKCCENNEIMVDSICSLANQVNISVWTPSFTAENGKDKVEVKYYRFINGIPACETTLQSAVFHFDGSEDRLNLLADGRLRHYIYHEHHSDSIQDYYDSMQHIGLYGRLNEPINIPVNEEPKYYDYEQGKYCMDKIFMREKNLTAQYALVCIPEVIINWTDTDFLMRKILNPLFHAVAMIMYLIVAIIYFILPTLRDLTGNIITTINICLILGQAADLVRIFTEFSSHVSFMVADIVLYISLLAAFFWLTSFGFYIWKTFKSRNVFLRVTDGRKYCYYSAFVWSCTAFMAVLAIVGHFLLDKGMSPRRKTNTQFSSSFITNGDQDTIGWLGIAIFFTPVAFTVIINIFFYVTTLQVINRMNTYGRIHHKLKHSFDMFLQLLLIMTVSLLLLLFSWLQYSFLFYCHVVINLLQAILVLYVCVVRQTHVMFLLRKSCCYSEPVPTGDWGDEMTHMNGGQSYM